jgi:hypothetical protein
VFHGQLWEGGKEGREGGREGAVSGRHRRQQKGGHDGKMENEIAEKLAAEKIS